MREIVRVGRTGADNSARSPELFPLCFPQGFPHYHPQNRGPGGGSFQVFRHGIQLIVEVAMASSGGRFDTESTL